VTAYRIDHVGVAVRSIAEARAIYEALGLEVTRQEKIPTQGVVTAFLPVGDSRVELVEPMAEDSPVGKFLARRGPGVHHICFAVDDLETALRDLEGRGFRLLHKKPVPGADGKRIAFLHPDSGHGLLIELSEEAKRPR